MLDKKERGFVQFQNTNWTEEMKRDARHYDTPDAALILEFHQNAKGYRKGGRHQIEHESLPLEHAQRYTVYRQHELRLAKGDKIRITKGGKTREGTRLNNGDIFTVKGFTRGGHIRLHTGKVLDKKFGTYRLWLRFDQSQCTGQDGG